MDTPQPSNDPGIVTMTLRVPLWLAKPLEEVVLAVEAAMTLKPPPAPIRAAMVSFCFTAGKPYRAGICSSSGGLHSIADSIDMLATMNGSSEVQVADALLEAMRSIEQDPGITPEAIARARHLLSEIAIRSYAWGMAATGSNEMQEHEAIEIARASCKFKTGASS